MEKYKRNDVVVLINENINVTSRGEKTTLEPGTMLSVFDQLTDVVWFLSSKNIKHPIFTNIDNIRHATPAEKFIYEKHVKKTLEKIIIPIKTESHESEK